MDPLCGPDLSRCPLDSAARQTRRLFVLRALGCAGAVTVAPGVVWADDPGTVVEIAAIDVQAGERRYPIPASDGVSIDQASSTLLVRYQGRVFALSMACPHQRAAVRWFPKDQRFQCSKHDSKYQPTGAYTSGRATRNLDRFPIRRDGDAVVVDVTQVFKSDQDPGAWANAAVAV